MKPWGRLGSMNKFWLCVILSVAIMAGQPVWAAPTISPDSGPIGIAITITGEGFGKFVSTRDNAVLFGKAPGLVEQWEGTRIVVRVPRKAATGPVVLKSGKKTMTVGSFTVKFPAVHKVSPAEATPGQTVQISGRNFGPTMGQKDSEMQFGVNEVLMNGVPAEVVSWRDRRIEVKVPSNATSGPLLVRLASVDPLPDGSCCAPVEYSATSPVTFTVVSPIMLEPKERPLGTPVVISGNEFGQRKPETDEVLLKNGDRLSGDIVKMDGESITIKTPYGGDIKIDWKVVQGVNTTGSQTFQMKDGSVLRGRISSKAPNQVTVTNDIFGSTKLMAISDISAINPPPLVTYEGSLNLAGAVNKGNSDTKAINGSVFYTMRVERQRLGLEGKYNYGEQDHKINVRNALAAVKYDLFITKQVYANFFTLFEQDTLQDLTLRSSLGAGPGYQFVDTPRTRLSAEVGLAFVNEDWRTQADTNSLAGRWAANFTTQLIPDRLIFFHRQEGYYDFKAPHGIRVRADQGFKVPVYKQFALNVEYDVRWNSEPAPGRKSTDQTYILGVSYLIPR